MQKQSGESRESKDDEPREVGKLVFLFAVVALVIIGLAAAEEDLYEAAVEKQAEWQTCPVATGKYC